jgi:hypothetical protein
VPERPFIRHGFAEFHEANRHPERRAAGSEPAKDAQQKPVWTDRSQDSEDYNGRYVHRESHYAQPDPSYRDGWELKGLRLGLFRQTLLRG